MVVFHTVQKDFIAQTETGDPTGSGTGGDSLYKLLHGDQARFFRMRFILIPNIRKKELSRWRVQGKILMLLSFISHCENVEYLDGKHTIFGEVVEGLKHLKG